MRNLLAASFFRVKRNKVFWLGMALLALAGAGTRISMYLDMKKYGVDVNLETSFFVYAAFVPVVLAVFVSLFLGTEYRDGTIRNKIVIGHRRSLVYGASLITSVLVGILLCAAYLIPALAVGIPLLGPFHESLWVLLLVSGGIFLLTVAYAAIHTAVAMLCQSRAVAEAFCILGVFLMLVAGMVIQGRLDEPEMYEPYSFSITSGEGNVVEEHQEAQPNPHYLRGVKRKTYEFLYDFLPGGQSLQLSNMQIGRIGRMAACSVGITVVATGIGLFFFRKKNLR